MIRNILDTSKILAIWALMGVQAVHIFTRGHPIVGSVVALVFGGSGLFILWVIWSEG
jgi:hypothetical protein